YDARVAELLTGYKWTSPLFDFDRKETIPDPSRPGRTKKVNTDLHEEGQILLISFTYDATLNPNNEDLEIKLYADPIEGALHCTREGWEYSNEWMSYDAYGCTVDVAGTPEPCQHEYDEGVVTTQPKCTEKGVKTFTCTKCGNTYTEDVDALGHDFAEEFTVDVEPTTTEPGSKSRHCSRCDAVTDVTEIPPITPPPVTEPTMTISSATIQKGDAEATFDVTVTGNPGVFSIEALVIYDKDMKYKDFVNGEVFPIEAIDPSPLDPDSEGMKDIDVDSALNRVAFKDADKAFEAQGVAYAGNS
ncbi:MAG: hypothetical protein IKN38_07660, partial [Clostridia bacterium]|nr:hypothetical protein [Clostridia bacterium]